MLLVLVLVIGYTQAGIETLTVSKLNLSPMLVSSLSSTNLIESSFSRARARLGKISNYSSGAMALRWCASALLVAESGFRSIKGFKDLWMLKTALDTAERTQVM